MNSHNNLAAKSLRYSSNDNKIELNSKFKMISIFIIILIIFAGSYFISVQLKYFN
jgi:hypothetical protein